MTPLLQRMSELEGFTPGEKKLADYFEHKNTQLAFENLAIISNAVGVGKATVTRFVQRLGYTSFADFLRSMRVEARSAMDQPFQGYAFEKGKQGASPLPNVLSHLEQAARNVQYAMEANRPEQIDKAVSLLADASRPLYIAGGATAYSLAYYAFLLLRYLRSNVYLLDADVGTLPHRLAGCEPNAMLFAISFHRFSRTTASIMRLFHEAGKPVLYLTDKHVNPLLAYSSCHIIAPSEGDHLLFSSRTSGMALVEALVAAATPPGDSAMEERLKDMEHIFKTMNTFHGS